MVAGYEQARCRCGAFAAWLSRLDRSRADARRRGASHFPFDGMGSAGQRRTLPRSCECLSWMRSTRAGAPHGPFSAQVALLDALNAPRRPERSLQLQLTPFSTPVPYDVIDTTQAQAQRLSKRPSLVLARAEGSRVKITRRGGGCFLAARLLLAGRSRHETSLFHHAARRRRCRLERRQLM